MVQVGYLSASIKSVEDAQVGDTITTARQGATEALPGYSKAKPMVFAGEGKEEEQGKGGGGGGGGEGEEVVGRGEWAGSGVRVTGETRSGTGLLKAQGLE